MTTNLSDFLSSNFQGAQGIAGEGTQGTQGIQGTVGAQGIAGEGTQGTQGIQGTVGATGLAAPRAVTIEAPSNSEKVAMFYTDSALSLASIRSVLAGSGSPSVTFSIRYGSDFSASGTEVVTGGITVTNTTTGLNTTSFNNGTISAGSFVWITTSAVSGTVNSLHVSLA
jgi:hypothetical protein